MCVWIIHTANLPAHFPSSRKSLRLNCLSCKLASVWPKISSPSFLLSRSAAWILKTARQTTPSKQEQLSFTSIPSQKKKDISVEGLFPPKNFNVPWHTLSLYPISKSSVRITHCGTTDKCDSPCLTRGPLSFFIFPVSLLVWSSLFCPFSSSWAHWIPSPFFLCSPSLPIFHNHLYFLFPLTWLLPPLISLPVSFPHVYLALSLSLVVSSLGKLKRCEEGNKSKSKNAFRGWRQAQTSVCFSEDS